MKLVVYGFSAIITLIVIIAMLGTINSFIQEVISSLSVGVPTKTSYCQYDSDCAPNPNNCSECINKYASALGLLKPCNEEVICECVSNKCLVVAE